MSQNEILIMYKYIADIYEIISRLTTIQYNAQAYVKIINEVIKCISYCIKRICTILG